MPKEEIRAMLVEKGLLKASKADGIDAKKIDSNEISADNSIYLFNRHGCFRRNIYFIQKHKYFDNFIMLLIALSSTKLALESYLVNMP